MSEADALQIVLAVLTVKLGIALATFYRVGSLTEKIAALTWRVEKLEEKANGIS